jgi:hypothetical protein
MRLSPESPIRAFAVPLIIAATALYAVLSHYGAVRDANRQNPDPYMVSDQLARFAAVRASLPPEATLCYLSDIPFEETRGSAMFFGAQYALAPFPLRLSLQPDHCRLVLGNFSQPVDFVEMQTRHRLSFVHDFGTGVVLFRPPSQ